MELWRRDAALGASSLPLSEDQKALLRTEHPLCAPEEGQKLSPAGSLFGDCQDIVAQAKAKEEERATKQSNFELLRKLARQPQAPKQAQRGQTSRGGSTRGRVLSQPFRGAPAGLRGGRGGRGRGRGRPTADSAGGKATKSGQYLRQIAASVGVSRRAHRAARLSAYLKRRAASRGTFSDILANMAAPRGKPLGRVDSPTGLHVKVQKSNSTFNVRSKGFYTSQRSRSSPSTSQGGLGDDTEKSDRDRSGMLTGFFQHPVSRAKGNRRLETSDRSLKFEQVPESANIFNGNTGTDSPRHAAGCVGGDDRFEGCVFSRSHETVNTQIPQIFLSGPSVAVQSFAFRTVHSPVDIHHVRAGATSASTPPRHSNTPILRRLVDQAPIPRSTVTTGAVGARPVSPDGFQGKCQEVRLVTASRLRLLGLSFSDYLRRCFPNEGARPKVIRVVPRISENTSAAGVKMAVSVRPFGSYGEISSAGQAAHEGASAGPAFTMVTGFRRVEPNSHGLSGSHVGHSMVERGSERSQGFSLPSASSVQALIYGREFGRVGGTLGHARSVGCVASSFSGTTYKCAGDGGCFPSSQALGDAAFQSNSSISHGQFYSRGLCEQAGRHEIKLPLRSNSAGVEMVPSEEHFLDGPPHPRAHERVGGPFVSGWSNSTHRMVTFSSSVRGTVRTVGNASSRPIRNSVEQQATVVCLADSGSISMVSRCAVDQLERDICVCVPTSSVDGKGAGEVSVSRMQVDTDSSLPSATTVVPGPSRTSHRPPSSASRSKGSVKTAEVGAVSSSSSQPQAPRVAAVERCFRKKGFSREVSSRIARANRKSSLAVYESKWRVFGDWCRGRKTNPFKATAPLISEFLLEKHDQGRAPSTLTGYRTAIAKTLKPKTGIDYGQDQELTALLNSFFIERPRHRNPVPAWDLSLVLNALLSKPFEPLERASLKFLTFKTVFLLALASGKRRSEIHALAFNRIAWKEDGSSVRLSVIPSFLAKTQLAGTPALSFSIPALSASLGPGLEEDAKLCPLRALRIYVDRTRELHLGKRLLFVSYLRNFLGEIRPATISAWIKRCVLFCYEQKQGEKTDAFKVKAHDVRALAASLAFTNHVSLKEVLEACSWASHNTFTSFYLRDVAWMSNAGHQLGPLVAAQSEVRVNTCT